jgi:cellulose synthase/poly-beta-1,6-N-acetylglucosamine synthase-like glycosyltransferase
VNLVSVIAAVLLAVVYSWTFYNLPVFIVGIKRHRRERVERKASNRGKTLNKDLPTFSIVVPAKNEEVVLPRLLSALLRQKYPKDKFEVIVVADGSTDATVDICRGYVNNEGGRIRVVHAEESAGKSSALNHALRFCKGDIIAVFDADNIPEEDALLSAAKHFQDGSVVALQGRTLTVNPDVNMLSKFLSYEETVWYEGYMKGKEALNLFVHLKGSCQFVRRETLESLGGWSEQHLSEDMEMSARLTERGHRIKYASDVRSWQESPENLTQVFRQRVRWFRGSMEVALKYGRLIRRPSFKTFDAEATLFGPFVLIISLLSYVMSPLAFCSLDWSAAFVLTTVGWGILTATLLTAALGLVFVARPKKLRDLLWFPFIYAYWSLQVFLATWALVRILCRAPRDWKKTPKTGVVTVTDVGILASIAPPPNS